LPSHLAFEVPLLPETGLSYEGESSHPPQLVIDLIVEAAQQDVVDPHIVTPDTPFTEPIATKRPRKECIRK
ncbi:hypothetical protein EV126DRAFT_342276, partial [Verticillium dahliae]